MISVEPLTCKSCFFLRSVNSRGHGLARGPDHLGDFFVRERECQLYLGVSTVMVCGDIQQEAG